MNYYHCLFFFFSFFSLFVGFFFSNLQSLGQRYIQLSAEPCLFFSNLQLLGQRYIQLSVEPCSLWRCLFVCGVMITGDGLFIYLILCINFFCIKLFETLLWANLHRKVLFLLDFLPRNFSLLFGNKS